jgi:hypothetical protein
MPSAMPDRRCCATCAAWMPQGGAEGTREITAFSISWTAMSARCGERRSPGFRSDRTALSTCGAWTPLVQKKERR